MRNLLVLITLLTFGSPFASLAQQGDSIIADDILISQDLIDAEVLRVSPRNHTITIRGIDSRDPQTFSVPDNATVTVRNRPARLHDVRRGDSVRLAMTPHINEVIVSQIHIPETNISLETRQANPVEEETIPAVLPGTASALPAILIMGILALFGASLLRMRKRLITR